MEIFHEYALSKNEPVCGNFLNLLNAADGFINNMAARIIAKFACYSTDLINQTDLHFYLNWTKEQLLSAVRQYYFNNKLYLYILDSKKYITYSTEIGLCTFNIGSVVLHHKFFPLKF